MPQYNNDTKTWQRKIVRKNIKDINAQRVDHYIVDVGIKSYATYRQVCQELLTFDSTISIEEVSHARNMFEEKDKRFEFIFTFKWYPQYRSIHELEAVLHSNKAIKHIAISPEYSEKFRTEEFTALTEDI